MTITQADREAAASAYFAWISGNPVIPGKMRSGEADDHTMVQAFARHRECAREQAMNDALAALKTVQYSPAPYTDGVKAIRTRFLHPGDGVNDPADNGE